MEAASALSLDVPTSMAPASFSGVLHWLQSVNTPLDLLSMLGSVMVALAGLLRVRCYRALGHLFTFHLSVRKDHRLVTRGPYAVVRHPSYTAILISFAGVLITHMSSGSWLRGSGLLDVPGMQTIIRDNVCHPSLRRDTGRRRGQNVWWRVGAMGREGQISTDPFRLLTTLTLSAK